MQLLHAVTVLGKPLDAVLGGALGGLPQGNDRALAHALVGQALRWLVDLDALIDSTTAEVLAPDVRVRQVLRVALVGALRLGTPPHAVIATALPLLAGGPRRLAHGVLSTLFKRRAALPPVPTLPPAWAARWRAQWGEDMVAAASAALAEVPPLDVAVQRATDGLEGVSLLPGHLRLAGTHGVEAIPGYASGDWWVQDVAAQLPVTLLGDVAGMRVLDLCAAPGGKTMQLAARGAHVVALEKEARRVARIEANLARTDLRAEIVVADALEWEPGQAFDAVLLDAPCSASGVFRRHPDLLHLKAMEDLGALLVVQAALRARAAAWLKPGGRMVYAVCSLERAEGEEHAPPPGVVAEPLLTAELPDWVTPAADGTVRVLPGMVEGGADGFFMARWRRG